jgi:hypothetical protein
MKRIESPPVIVPMLRVSYAPDSESSVDGPPRRARIRRSRRQQVSRADDKRDPALDQVRMRLLKMIVQNERERSHDNRAS